VKAVTRSVLSSDDFVPDRAGVIVTREIQILRGLEHPNIMPVFEYGLDGQGVYILTKLYQISLLDVVYCV
jgi:serine/threonine protein kinase